MFLKRMKSDDHKIADDNVKQLVEDNDVSEDQIYNICETIVLVTPTNHNAAWRR